MPLRPIYPTGIKDAAGRRLTIETLGDGEYLKREGNTITSQAGGVGGYTDENAQDAVGSMADTNTLTYTDATPKLEVKLQMSITSDASGLKLSGDATTPGASKVYGTDGSGVKGWKVDPAGLADAPSDGTTYGRNNAAWTTVASGIADAASDGTLYGRKNAAWSTVPSSLADAPSDGAAYGRLNAAWATVLTTVVAHTMGGVSHSTDTLANLNGKINDADVPAIAGQIGGSAMSPIITGITETGGPTALTIGTIADGEYLKRVGGTLVSAVVSASGLTHPQVMARAG